MAAKTVRLRAGKTGRVQAVDTGLALGMLREAYGLLAHAPRTRERVRLAITSCCGAYRHAHGQWIREQWP